MKRKAAQAVAPSLVQSRNPAEVIVIDGHRYRLIPERPAVAVEPEFTPVVIGGKTYKMCLEMEPLCAAELGLMREGRDVNLIRLFGNFSFRAVREMFAVSVRFYHPELDFDEACRLVTLPYGIVVGSVLARSMTKDLPDPEPQSVAAESTEAA